MRTNYENTLNLNSCCKQHAARGSSKAEQQGSQLAEFCACRATPGGATKLLCRAIGSGATKGSCHATKLKNAVLTGLGTQWRDRGHMSRQWCWHDKPFQRVCKIDINLQKNLKNANSNLGFQDWPLELLLQRFFYDFKMRESLEFKKFN